jgi:hypothetical protein
LPALARAKQKAQRISCVNSLKQVGTAYKVWAGDNQDRMPQMVSTNDGGARDFFTNATPNLKFVYKVYTAMGNELGQSPRVLCCPSEGSRTGANTFGDLMPLPNSTNVGDIANGSVSYFIGMGASDNYPQSLLSGDRNIAMGQAGGNTQAYLQYGVGCTDGTSAAGFDAVFPTVNNTANANLFGTSGYSWSMQMHSAGSAQGAGNVLLGDSSVQQSSSARLRSESIINAADGSANNCLSSQTQVVANTAVRILFP